MQHCLLRHKNNLKDFDLYEIWDRLLESGTTKTVFYDGSVNTHHEFRDVVRRDCNEFFITYYDGKPACAAWVNDRRERSGRIHFFVFKPYWGRKRDELPKSVMVARYTAAMLVRSMPFDVLYGFTPVRNVLACKFIQKVGAVPVGILPHGCWNAGTGESEDTLFTAITRESTEDEWTKY